MQSGGGNGGGPSRNPGVGPVGRAASTSSAASPTSSSSAVSTPRRGFDSGHQQQHQQLGPRQQQVLQQQQLQKSEGNEAHLSYQAGGIQGLLGGSNSVASPGSMQLAQQSRNFFEFAQQEGSQGSQRAEQQSINPLHQAYNQYALQAQHQKSAMASLQQQQQQLAKMGNFGSASAKEQDRWAATLKMQEMVSMQAAANQAHASSSKTSPEQFGHGGKQMEHGQQPPSEQRNELKPPLVHGHIIPGNTIRPMQATPGQQGIQNMGNSQIPIAAQLQAIQAWAVEHNIDLSHPSNANLMGQLLPRMQTKMAAHQRGDEGNPSLQPSSVQVTRQHVASPTVPNESSPHANSSSDMSGQSGSMQTRKSAVSGPFGQTSSPGFANNANNIAMQQFSVHGRENPMPSRQAIIAGNGNSFLHTSHTSKTGQAVDQPLSAKNPGDGGPETSQMLSIRHLNRPSPHSAVPTNDGGSAIPRPLQAGSGTQQKLPSGFTKQQLHVLKAQILAFRRLKKGECSLPQELLRAIDPPPLELQLPQHVLPVGGNEDRYAGRPTEDQSGHLESSKKEPQAVPSTNPQKLSKEEACEGDKKANILTSHVHGLPTAVKDPVPSVAAIKEEQQTAASSAKSDQEAECGVQKAPTKNDFTADRGKAIVTEVTESDTDQVKKPVQAATIPQAKDAGSARKYHGPLFDFPFFTRKHDSYGSALPNSSNNLKLQYSVRDILFEEGMEVFNKKRTENLKKISCLLAVNLERKRIRPDLVLRLQIEEKKLRLMDRQARLRDEVDQQQQEIMAMPDRPYRKFVRLCERQRLELARQVQSNQKAIKEKQLKAIFQWRKKLLEAHWTIRDSRTARNRGVAKYHEKMLREFSKRKDEDRNKRMEALKNNDVERYRQMLLEKQTSITGDAAERYAVLSSFLSQTEEYLHKLGSKITAAKNQQEVEEASNAAAGAARLQGLSEEEVRAAAACAGEEVMIRNQFTEMNAPKDSSSVRKYYKLAHAVNERVMRQPSMLRAGTLRDYQLVGLQWMLSLYNNKLNGILADEMGLGKTVQVMALIAYLMEFKGNYGPHLIIVPNAVLVNWKSELHTWLPSVSCIYYVGTKDQRAKLFSQEITAVKFNVLVTTYEFIMYDKSKLSKIDWKYIIIDEAQRMKDRESVLARDLDKYRCQRRLLLTGTPLQNDLKELWSLLNLLLPEVFDNRKAFHDWFAQPFQKDAPAHTGEDDWLETEKKVIVIHRLHQILEPFMLRRRVEDVEGSLPPKVSVILRCRMSSIQSTIYDWIKSTGTLRLDPEDLKAKPQKSQLNQLKPYKPLQNRCMELRKTCNHPLLNYPYFNDFSKAFLVRSCGKLWIMDRILIKLQRTGHRVLLFSTMTKLLDILEEYLQWRRLVYRRIDGTTSLEERESAIVDFNSPGTDCFIFLLSIRAAGRGLNLQSADTVIIYDPDPNPKNEEQAVARAHRIGQTREVKVIYMEAVVDKVPSHQKEDEIRSGGSADLEDDLAGKDRYIGSIESLIRNNIQQYKIDMADEVINAGRFDQRTTHEERRVTLEALLHDEERYQETVHDVPSLYQVNRMIARSEEEVELFDQMDEEFDWTEEMTSHEQVPEWLRASSREVNTVIDTVTKKPSRSGISLSNIEVEPDQVETERKRRRSKGKKHPNYKEIDDESGELSEASSAERNGYSVTEEEEEIGDSEDDELGDGVGDQKNKDQSEDDGPVRDGGYSDPRASGGVKKNYAPEENGSSGSSPDTRRKIQMLSPLSSKKFGSLSALDARPGTIPKKLSDELEEGEIALSGGSPLEIQQSESWVHDRDEGEDEQVIQPKIKRKRSIRHRPRQTLERPEEKYGSDVHSLQRGESSMLPFQMDRNNQAKLRTDLEIKTFGGSSNSKLDQPDSSSKLRRNLATRRTANTSKLQASPRSNRSNRYTEDTADKESWEGKPKNLSGAQNVGAKMSETIQRRCKNVISKFQRRIDKEGHQIVPMLTSLWKRMDSDYMSGDGNAVLNLRQIDHRVDMNEYAGVMGLVSDVQYMLKCSVQFYGFSHEVRSEARKVHNLFFDILKIAFPDIDFIEARNAVSFTGPSSNTSISTASPRQTGLSQGKRHKLPPNEVESEPRTLPKSQLYGSFEDTRIRVQIPQTRLGNGGGGGSGSSSRELSQQQQSDEPSLLAHPGELVICKKKRRDREKSRTGSIAAVSPPSMTRGIRSPGPVSTRTATAAPAPHQQGWSKSSGGEPVGWANPVKRLRTDSGKRRPSHL